MTPSIRQRRAPRRAVRYKVWPALDASQTSPAWRTAQRLWTMAGLMGGAVTLLGFQTLPPSRRLAEVERVNARQDSVIAEERAVQREALAAIRQRLGQLLAGQCVKERDRMARVVYGCGGER